MDHNDNHTDTHQIFPDYNLEMEYAELFNDSDDELNVMAEYYRKLSQPVKKTVPQVKELRVRVKRLSKSVIDRYLKKKIPPKLSSSVPPGRRIQLQHPAPRPFPQQLIFNKKQPQIRHIIKSSIDAETGPAQSTPKQWRTIQQSVISQKPVGIANTKNPIPIKLLPNKIQSFNQQSSLKRSLPNNMNIIPIKKRQDSIEAGCSKSTNLIKKLTTVDAKSKYVKEVLLGDRSHAKGLIDNSGIKSILAIKDKQPQGLVTKIIDGKRIIVRAGANSKIAETSPKNVTSNIVGDNKPLGIDKHMSMKIPLKTIQQLHLGRNVKEGIKTNVQVIKVKSLSELNRSNIILAPPQRPSTSGANANKSLHDKNQDDKQKKDQKRNSLNINISKNNIPLASDNNMMPKIVKVPVSKLIKIPPGFKIVGSSNNDQNIEKVNMNKVIIKPGQGLKTEQISESLTPKMEMKIPEMVKIPQTVKITNIGKSPSTSKMLNLPIKQITPAAGMSKDSKAITVKKEKKESHEMLESKVVQSRKVATAPGKSNFQVNDKSQLQSSQSDTRPPAVSKNDKRPNKTCVNRNTQTKFTCHDNIGAVIDTGDFSINCFYCYDTFSLRKWPTFIQHMITCHNIKGHSLAVANSLLSPQNIIPFATKSKQVQVNTLKGRPLLGGGGQRVIETMNTSAIEQRHDLSLDDNDLDNDLEMALNCLEEDDESEIEVEVVSSRKLEKLPPKKMVKLEAEENSHSQTYTIVEPKIEENSEIKIVPKVELVDNKPPVASSSSDAIKLANRNTIHSNIHLNTKTSGKSPNTRTIAEQPKTDSTDSKSLQSLTKNKSLKTVAIDNLVEPGKSKDSNESCKINTSMESNDTNLNEISIQPNRIKTDEDAYDYSVSCLDESITIEKNITLDVSQTNVEQNIKIEPQYDIDNNNEQLLPKKEKYTRHKNSTNSRKNTSKANKATPIPSNLLDSDDEMPSNDENEDAQPSPTNGCGILFGLTNRNIVIDFIENLEKYPELWRFSRGNDITVNYNESIRRLHQHINKKFNLEMTDFEVRLSVQRIKHWYCRTLQKMERHNRDQPLGKRSTFRITFPVYFKMLGKFLTNDSNCTKDLVLGKRFQSKDVNDMYRYPKWMIYKDHVPGDNKDHVMVKEENCSLARDLELSDFGEWEEAEAEARSRKPFKCEIDTSAGPPDPFICDICFVDFNSMVDLVRHRLRHFPPQYPCNICQRRHYTSLAADNCAHASMRTGILSKPTSDLLQSDCSQYVCEICGVSYTSMSTLNCHKRDKHFNMRQKCPVCQFTSISNYRMLQHQRKRHVVEFGTCEQIAIKTRARTDSKVPYDTLARKEFEWRRELRKSMKPGENLFGCFKCKMVFNTRKELLQHNRQEHPITEYTVMCLLCKREKSLLSNSNSVRRHYTDVHKVPWDEIDDLVKKTKPLFQILSPLEVDYIKTSENPTEFVTKLLMRKHKAEIQNTPDKVSAIASAIKTETNSIGEELNPSYNPFKYENNADNEYCVFQEESLDNEYFQTSFFNDIGIDQEYNEMHEDSLYDEDDNDNELLSRQSSYCGDADELQQYEGQDEEANTDYFIEEECMQEEYNNVNACETIVMENGVAEEQIIEETVEYDFMENMLMDDHY